jgi:GT2 family glycosyltransferase
MSEMQTVVTSAPPTTSVVIPGHNAAATLRPCIDALRPLLESGRIREIVFVDDHSTDDTRALLEQYPVRVLSSPRRGAGAARNTGWRATTADHVWFVDADCVSHADALDRLYATMEAVDAAVVGGSYSNQNRGRLTSDLIHEEMVARHRSMGTLVTFAITANLLCRRQTLEALGGFDESLRLGQDLDFAYRVVHSGRRLAFDATSQVGHFHETRLLSYLYKQARQGYWRMHLYRRHPGKMTGDTYSGLSDYVQPPLAVLAVSAPVAGALLGAPLFGCAVGAGAGLALLGLQLPMAVALVRATGDVRYWCYVPFGAARAAYRALGMILGIASTLTTKLEARALQRT